MDPKECEIDIKSKTSDHLQQLYVDKEYSTIIHNPQFDSDTGKMTVDIAGEPIFKNFDKSKCNKINKKTCLCQFKISSNGYYIECVNCNHRIPSNKNGYLVLPQSIVNLFINFSIDNSITNSNNNTTNITQEAQLSKYEVRIKYPLNIKFFRDEDTKNIFQNILLNHSPSDIVFFIKRNYDLSYNYYKDKTIYSGNELITDIQLYKDFIKIYEDLINKLIEYYKENTDLPIIKEICYNKHILINLEVLKDYIFNSKDTILPYILDTIKTNILRRIPIKNEEFIRKIKYSSSRKDYITLTDILYKYNEWYISNECNDIKLNKNTLKEKIINHIKFINNNNNNEKIGEYKQYSINCDRISGWIKVMYV